MSRTTPTLLLYAFIACKGTGLMILKIHHFQEADHLREKENCIKNCLSEMSRRSQLGECC